MDFGEYAGHPVHLKFLPLAYSLPVMSSTLDNTVELGVFNDSPSRQSSDNNLNVSGPRCPGIPDVKLVTFVTWCLFVFTIASFLPPLILRFASFSAGTGPSDPYALILTAEFYEATAVGWAVGVAGVTVLSMTVYRWSTRPAWPMVQWACLGMLLYVLALWPPIAGAGMLRRPLAITAKVVVDGTETLVKLKLADVWLIQLAHLAVVMVVGLLALALWTVLFRREGRRGGV